MRKLEWLISPQQRQSIAMLLRNSSTLAGGKGWTGRFYARRHGACERYALIRILDRRGDQRYSYQSRDSKTRLHIIPNQNSPCNRAAKIETGPRSALWARFRMN